MSGTPARDSDKSAGRRALDVAGVIVIGGQLLVFKLLAPWPFETLRGTLAALAVLAASATVFGILKLVDRPRSKGPLPDPVGSVPDAATQLRTSWCLPSPEGHDANADPLP